MPLLHCALALGQLRNGERHISIMCHLARQGIRRRERRLPHTAQTRAHAMRSARLGQLGGEAQARASGWLTSRMSVASSSDGSMLNIALHAVARQPRAL